MSSEPLTPTAVNRLPDTSNRSLILKIPATIGLCDSRNFTKNVPSEFSVIISSEEKIVPPSWSIILKVPVNPEMSRVVVNVLSSYTVPDRSKEAELVKSPFAQVC